VTNSDSLRGLGARTVEVPFDLRGSTLHLTLHLDDALAFAGLLAQVPSGTLLVPR
jgi:hypothetical protein